MCANVAKFKKDIMTGKDKWADNVAEGEESGEGSTDIKEEVKKAELKHVVKDLKDVMVQRYLENPCLYKGRKFDMRAFMVVISAKPWFVYAHPGYTRVSLEQFTMDDFGQKTKEARGRHLTNLAIQKKSPLWKDHKNDCVLTAEELAAYLMEQGKVASVEDYHQRVTSKINEIMRLMWLQIKDRLDRKFGCFEVFGFDFMLDEGLNPHFLEVNMNPAMFCDTKVLSEMLPKLVSDCCNLAVEIHKDHKKEADVDTIRALLKDKCKLPYEELFAEV
jgi:tubulin polyglutamylase TTLL9